jgi:hypothetical protein
MLSGFSMFMTIERIGSSDFRVSVPVHLGRNGVNS